MSKGPAADQSRPATILVVDDALEILALLETRLRRRGFDVMTAADGEAALVAARARTPDLVILDIMMPRRNGWEVARALKKDPATQATKIVVLTAIGEQVNEITSPLYGADAYLDKPFDFDELERIIDDLLAR
ncbi:MAG TPA: response regulator [Kofleriaceae bacterium]|nr:response regulator [Kofleriaceae bacterium]